MKRTICAAGLLAVAAGAQAAPFQAVTYEAGGGLPGIVGAGFSVDFGGFFTHVSAGTNVGPGAAAGFTAINFHEFDSHFALDTVGPSVRNRSTGTANNSNMTLNFYGRTGTITSFANPNYADPVAAGASRDYNEGSLISGYTLIVGPGSHIGDFAGDASNPENMARAGIGVAPPPVASGFAPNDNGGRSALDGVFIGRFTVKAGATLTGGGLFNVMCAACPGGFNGFHMVLDGPAVVFGTNSGPQPLILKKYYIGRVDITEASAATAAGVNENEPFGLADVYDVWFQLLPTPGAAALFGLGALTAIRRRRA